MFDNSLPGLWSQSVHDVQYARRKASLYAELCEKKGRHWSKLRWLGYYCASRCERRSDLPGKQIQWKIPWRNTTSYTGRDTQSIVNSFRASDVRFGCHVNST